MSGFLSLALAFVLEHRRPPLDLAQSIAVPHELRPNPELGFDAKCGFEQQRGLGGDALLAAQYSTDLRNRNAHALGECGLAQATTLDEFFAENLPRTLRRLRRRDADGKNQAKARSRVGSAGEDCGARRVGAEGLAARSPGRGRFSGPRRHDA